MILSCNFIEAECLKLPTTNSASPGCLEFAILSVQVASQETYGTLGAIVKSRTGSKQVGFLTNRHVAVDLDYPNQKMFHPLPPNLGPGVYLGAVERATSFITDDVWYGIYAGTNPGNKVPYYPFKWHLLCEAGFSNQQP